MGNDDGPTKDRLLAAAAVGGGFIKQSNEKHESYSTREWGELALGSRCSREWALLSFFFFPQLLKKTKNKTPKQRETGAEKAVVTQHFLRASTDRKPSVTLCPAAREASLFSAPSAAVSQRDGAAQLPADPITRPTNQACESTSAHRHRCRVCGGRGDGRGGFARCPFCHFFFFLT